MSKSPPGIRVTIPPDLKAWIDTQAEDLGCDAATWIRMLIVDCRKQGRVVRFRSFPAPVPQMELPLAPPPSLGDPDPHDAWRGPVEDEPAEATSADIAAVIERGLAEAEAAGATAPPSPPTEMFARQPPTPVAGATRALSRPPSRYVPATQPAHLRAL